MDEVPKKRSISTIIITVTAIIIILALAFLFYYFTVKSISVISETSLPFTKASDKKQEVRPVIVPTNVIKFSAPATLPVTQKNGDCFANSVAQPFRSDAWRCMVGNAISDPCFETGQREFVFCQMNPLVPDSFLIKLTKVLPAPETPANKQTNWAWFLTLKDGTICSPFTGTRPFFGNPPDVQAAYYGCKSNNPAEQIVLLGDLIEGAVWKANKAILTKTGGTTSAWTISSTQQVDIETVWQ